MENVTNPECGPLKWCEAEWSKVRPIFQTMISSRVSPGDRQNEMIECIMDNIESSFKSLSPIRTTPLWPYEWTRESECFRGCYLLHSFNELSCFSEPIDFSEVEKLFLEYAPREKLVNDPSKKYIALYKDDDPSPPRILSIRSTLYEAVLDIVAEEPTLSEEDIRALLVSEMYLTDGRDGWYISTYTNHDNR